jgi:hypothetical protein
MGFVVEITPRVDIEVRRDSFRFVDGESELAQPEFDYELVPALSRALNIVKDSPRYVAWLKRKGLA